MEWELKEPGEETFCPLLIRNNEKGAEKSKIVIF
jgi:hypothetical protein